MTGTKGWSDKVVENTGPTLKEMVQDLFSFDHISFLAGSHNVVYIDHHPVELPTTLVDLLQNLHKEAFK